MQKPTTAILMALLLSAARIALAAGATLNGTVLDSAGKPAPDAAVYLVNARQALILSAEGEPVTSHDPPVKPDAQGRFSLTSKTDKFLIVAVTTDGIAECDESDFARSLELHLAAWASIDGKVMIGSAPGGKVRVEAASIGTRRRTGPDFPPQLLQVSQMTAADDGTFHFAKVMPGDATVSRTILTPESNGQLTQRSAFSKSVTLAAGAKQNLTLGGVGRPVVGSINIPPELAARKDWFTRASVRRMQPGQTNDDAFAIAADGKFRVDDCEPGNYHLTVQMRPSKSGADLAQAHFNFSVPPINGPRSDEPLDIGAIAAQLGRGMNTPEAPPAPKPANGRPVIGRVVLPKEAGDVKQMHIRTRLIQDNSESATDSDGTFHIDALKPGEYSIQVYATVNFPDDYFAFAQFAVKEPEVGKADATVNLGDIRLKPQPGFYELRKMPPDQTPTDLSGRVTDETGAALAGATVTFTQLGTEPGAPAAISTEDGSFQFTAVITANRVVRAEKNGYFSKYVSAHPGSKNDLSLRSMPRFSGAVTDAETHKPIKRFTVIQLAQSNGVTHHGTWSRTEFSDGKYELTPADASGGASGWYFRVEAPGYMPQLSPELKVAKARDFQLAAAPNVQGRVISPDGKPVAAAFIAALPMAAGNIWGFDGQWQVEESYKFNSGPDGKFSIPPDLDQRLFAVTAPEGSAILNLNAGAQPGDVRLLPWSKAVGTTQPGRRVTVHFLGAGEWAALGWSAVADANGAFQFDQLPPGAYVATYLQQGPPFAGIPTENIMQPTKFSVLKGATAVIHFGGGGHAIRGKVIFPAGYPDAPNVSCLVRLVRKDPDLDGQFPASVDDTGIFHADDLAAGDYTLHISAYSHVTDKWSEVSADFTVPAVDNGPVTIPDISVSVPPH